MHVKCLLLLFAAVSLSIACATAKQRVDGQTSHSQVGSCPAGSEMAHSMIENFLTNPDLADARATTGTDGISASQIQLVNDAGICQQLNSRYDQYADYNTTYYKAGNRYFATLILKQPDDPNQVVTGVSIIVILNSNLEKIESYAG